jgi:hypothetical protein
MGVADVMGLFSRFFVVGFFVPSFTVIVAFDELFGGPVREEHLLLIAGIALLVALLLLGLGSPLWSLFEGYWRGKQDGVGHAVYWTRFGEATRQYRRRGCELWGLDTWAAWPYIDALFSEREREIHVDALANVRFFLNSSVGMFVVAGGFLAHAVDESAFGWVGVALVCVCLSYLLYRGAVTAAEEWGEYKIASVGLHRRQLYEHFGLPSRSDPGQERVVAAVVNALLVEKGESGSSLAKRLPLSNADLQTIGGEGRPCEDLIREPGECREQWWQIWRRRSPKPEATH